MSVVFHLLDIAQRDEEIVAETEDAVEIAYETTSEASDDEYIYKKKKKDNDYNASTAAKSLVLTLFGSDAQGTPVKANVRGFKPFFYVEVPGNLPRKAALNAVGSYLEGQLGKSCREVIDLALITKKRLFGYNKQTEFPYIQISLPSCALFNKVKRLFLDGKNDPLSFAEASSRGKPHLGAPFKQPPIVYEANLDPLLRFLHLRNISPCNWITITTEETNVSTAGSTIEIDCDWTEVAPTKDVPAPTAPFMVASWDIEVWSSTGEFPLAQRSWSNVVRPFYAAAGGNASRFAELLVKAVDPVVSPSEMPRECYKIQLLGAMTDKRLAAFKDRMDKIIQKKDVAACFTGAGNLSQEERENRRNTIGNVLRKEFDLSYPLRGDPVIQIGTVLQRIGQAEAEKHIYVLGSCSAVPGAVVHTFDDEAELIVAWCKWIVEAGVDIYIGYNIFGFDERYMWNRMEELGITEHEAVQAFNRLEGSVMKLEEKRLSSSAMGDNFLYLWTTTGRLRIDVFHHIKRTASLASYKLDDTSRYYLSEDVVAVEHSGAIEDGRWIVKYKQKKQTASVGSAVALLGENGENLCDKTSIIECGVEDGTGLGGSQICWFIMEEPMDVEPTEVAKWAVVKDDVSPAEMFKLHLGSADDRAIIAKYCVQDCMLVLDLYKKLEIFNYSMSMANVCSVPVSYIFLRGQGIKIESLIFKYCYEKGYAVQVIGAPKGAAMSYEGAIVLTPTPQFATVPVGVADFASLYPSTMISENISFDTLVWVKDYDLNGRLMAVEWVSSCFHGSGTDDYDELEGVEYTDIEFDLFVPDPEDKRKNPENIKIGTRVCRYAQDSVGMVPQIVSLLLAARKAKREELKKTPDPFKKALLDSEQNAYKITANSLYGQLGSPTFKLRLQYLAASVTAYGRKQIMFARDVIMRFYGPGSGDPRCCASATTQSTHTAPYKNGAEIVYGDSVKGDTPIYVRIGGVARLFTIGDLGSLLGSGSWRQWHETKECIEPGVGVEVWTDEGWTMLERVIKHRRHVTKKMYRIITRTGLVDVTEDHSLITDAGLEIAPGQVSLGTRLLHNQSYNVDFENTIGNSPITGISYVYGFNEKMEAANKCIEILRGGAYPSFEYSSDERRLIIKVNKDPIVGASEVIHIEEICDDDMDYVYDLQTANHHFSVGPGSLVVHNTDSLFVCFNPRNPETGQPLEGEEALKETIHLTEEAGQLVTKALKAPHDFEFDKVYWPFLIFSKKRYVGHKYEELDHYTQASMGIALKRRDYAPIVKKVYGGAVEILLKEKNVPKAVEFVQRSCVDLINGRYGLGPLTISKSLRAEYANPQGVAHKVLADRMAARDPGTAPTVGDRIPFVYIQPPAGQQAADLQGERIEHPSYIKEKSLKPDYMFYITNQISNPVIQMFGIMLEQMPGYSGPPVNGWSANEDKRAAEREAAAYEILFRDAIAAHRNTQTRRFMSLFGQVKTEAGAQVQVQPKPESFRPKLPQPAEPRPVLRQTTLDCFKKKTTLDSMNDDILLLNAKKDIKKTLEKATKKQLQAKSKE